MDKESKALDLQTLKDIKASLGDPSPCFDIEVSPQQAKEIMEMMGITEWDAEAVAEFLGNTLND